MYTPELVQKLEGHEWLRKLRADAAASVNGFSYPSHEEEEWRYSPIDKLELDRFTPALSKPLTKPSGIERKTDEFHTISTVDGFLLSHDDTPTYEVHSASDLEEPIAFDTPIDMLSSMNLAFSPDPILIRVPRGSKVERPLVIDHRWEKDNAACFPMLRIEIEENAEIEIVEIFHHAEINSLVVPETKIGIGNGSNVNYQQVQNLGPNVWQLGVLDISVGQQANFHGAIAAIGGSYARLKTSCSLNGRGASGKVSAIYHGNEDQVLDFRTTQEHVDRDTQSELLFKGVLDDESTSIYTGLINVHKKASGTNAFQTNRTLKLCDRAWAESVPNLEIENNDVKCSHASTVSPIDEDQRFYLESRGVPTLEAEKLIVHGFLQEVVSSLPVDEINGWIADLYDQKLSTRMIYGK
ncbi:MAG: Fe-S cluster assembly protein SufD [Actinomycetota bacterium]|nr:Fe-S cluster assembly protein SufD [Actinomycetota bacterium]